MACPCARKWSTTKRGPSSMASRTPRATETTARLRRALDEVDHLIASRR
jgi:hypothetical protein